MKAWWVVQLLATALFLVSCGTPPSVIQGEVVQYDGSAEKVTIGDEAAPEKTYEFSLRGADIGAKPNPGDVVRIAYLTKDGIRTATRIMNISRQKEMKTRK